ncbi:Crp/Fnr family transcriptional regulator [Fulvivirga sedimenti]|uniref:Crp/Fnr family transcriptional regulator n=1 Tax=Fulvivirga sedimenti TaxID=2879465 RepID=A0A9X1HK26_9BACT|nr:Crp/Fnr family transcriptional regulator [Fulvivirga sedimenti]MCA6073573.1 Crp/Fnr family transcriptional regulator [Fulvivirga sedimenti]
METSVSEAKSRAKDVLSLMGFEEKLLEEILSTGRVKKVKAGQTIISPGVRAEEIPLVIEGTLKVMRQDEAGNEIFLYYLEGGDTCAMSITCCLENKLSEFVAIAEEDSLLWLIPVSSMDAWVSKYPSFRRFVFASYQSRFDELLTAIDSVAFMKMDERLYKYLLDKKQASGSYVINKTHQEIARELNTSRVVVSRLIKKLENEGKVEQHRNRIEIL